MFKRANKVTALLVAAASIMSIVPAMASTRLGTKDGHIKDGAIAFEDGKYLYDGYRTTDDDTGIYYNDGSEEKEKFNEDLRDYKIYSKYGTKYAYANDGADQYLIDLSTGKIVDEETPEDKADSVKSKLKAALKKTDRYAYTGIWDSVDLGDSLETEVNYNANRRILASDFGDVWYLYSGRGDRQTSIGRVTGNDSSFATFTIKLPVSEGTTRFQLGPVTNVVTGATAIDVVRGTSLTTGVINETLDAFKARILTAIKANASFANIYDVNTIAINADKTTITGQAKIKGDLTKNAVYNAAFATFTTNYGAVLGAASVDTYTTTDGALRLNDSALVGAISSDQTVVTSITSGSQVTISKVGLGNATVTVKNTAGRVATLNVSVTTPDGIKITKTTKFWSEVEVQNALIAITQGNAAALTLADFEAVGIGENVVTQTGSSTTLSVSEAIEAIKRFIANDGKLGALNRTLTKAEVVLVLDDALAKKKANVSAAAVLTVTTGVDAVGALVGISNKYSGYVNESGKYIDVSSVANIYVYSKNEGKTIKIKEYNKRNVDFGITVGLQSIRPLAQDKDYIYQLVQVGVLEDVVSVSNTYPTVQTQYFIQKVSKAQGETKDGAYTPKSVDSYQVDNKSIFDNGDSNVVYNLLIGAAGAEDGFTRDHISVKDGALYIAGVKADGDHDKLKIFKVALKKDKNDLVSTVAAGKGDRKDVDVYIAKKDADTDMDIRQDTRDTAVSYDVDGNTWAVSKGTVTKITGTDKKDIYTCDRTFDNIDAYDEKNLIVWGDDSEVYSNVGEGTKVTQSESTAVAPVIVTGWVKGTDGTWTFNDATGTKVVSKWQNIGGVWYYLKADGIMATGWYNDNGTWYYLQGSGAMATGWLNDNGTWYYLAGSGAMLSNTVVDGYTLGASGAWVK